jgi:hypothetical protein
LFAKNTSPVGALLSDLESTACHEGDRKSPGQVLDHWQTNPKQGI